MHFQVTSKLNIWNGGRRKIGKPDFRNKVDLPQRFVFSVLTLQAFIYLGLRDKVIP